MKNITTLLTALCAIFATITTASAQQLTITKSASAQEALDKIDMIKQPTEVKGYRIGIFFDNGQDARSKALEAKELFAKSFPTQPVHMVYESPYYKVSAGNCLTEEESIMLFERVRPIFPNAFVMRENLKISAFTESAEIVAPILEESEEDKDTATQEAKL